MGVHPSKSEAVYQGVGTVGLFTFSFVVTPIVKMPITKQVSNLITNSLLAMQQTWIEKILTLARNSRSTWIRDEKNSVYV